MLPMAEAAIREALRNAVREALHDVSVELGAPAKTAPEAPLPTPVRARASFGDLSDAEAWERFDAIRFARLAGMSHTQAS